MASIWQSRFQPHVRQGTNFLEWLKSAQLAVSWAIVLLMLAIAGGIFLAQVSQTALAGRNAQLLTEQIRVMQTKNAVMRQELAEKQSLQSLNARTEALGMVYELTDRSENKTMTVVVPVFPEGYESVSLPSAPIATMEEAIWLWMQSRFLFIRGLTGGA